ncbi:MAG: tripartite tricarboxylate transporter TctB family protein [Pseudomonadota bacterium]
MTTRSVQLNLGIGACLAALFLVFYAIPAWVSSPSNVKNVVLSPLFWPYVLAAFTGIAGLGLIASWAAMPETDEPLNEPVDDLPQAWMRLGAMAAIMVGIMAGLTTLGMVWTSMIAFAAVALMLRTRFPVAAVICAVIIPLVLYAFFAHVAGVAIPQGLFVRLP